MSSHVPATCTSALLLLPLGSAMPKADLKRDRNSKPQLALMELFHLQNFVSTMGETARGETPFGPTFPSITSKQPNIPNIFIDYKRCLELDASLHTQKWILPHAKYHCVLKYFWDKEFAADAAKWELLTGMKQTLFNLKIFKFWGRIVLYLWHKSCRYLFKNKTATWSKLLKKSDIIIEVQLKITIFTCLVKNTGAERKIKIRCSVSKSPIFHYWSTV